MILKLTDLTSAAWNGRPKIRRLTYWIDSRRRLRCRFPSSSRSPVVALHRPNRFGADGRRYGSLQGITRGSESSVSSHKMCSTHWKLLR
jgi:hypothetical protein